MASRPELQAPQEIFYNDEEARRYTSSSRIIDIQAQLSERALELLALPDDDIPRLLLDIEFTHESSPCNETKTHAADETTAVGNVFITVRSENPTEPPTFAQLTSPVGNAEFIAELKAITMNIDAYYNGIFITIRDSMLQAKTEFNDANANECIASVALQLTNAACLVTYLKLRALLMTELPQCYTSANLRRPKGITHLPIGVVNIAFAIQQLGVVNIANLPRETRFVSVLPEMGHKFGIPVGQNWNLNLYAQAVDCVVNLNQKRGTAWWLLRQHHSEDMFMLKLPFPEVNFTSSMALTHCLFLHGHQPNPTNVIFDLTPCGDRDYGSILRDPHIGINVTTFQNICETAKEIVSNNV